MKEELSKYKAEINKSQVPSKLGICDICNYEICNIFFCNKKNEKNFRFRNFV